MSRRALLVAVAWMIVSPRDGAAQENREQSFKERAAAWRKQLEIYYPNDPKKREQEFKNWLVGNGLMKSSDDNTDEALGAAKAATDPKKRKILIDEFGDQSASRDKVKMGTELLRNDTERHRARKIRAEPPVPNGHEPDFEDASLLWDLGRAKAKLEYQDHLGIEKWVAEFFEKDIGRLAAEAVAETVLMETFVKDVEKLEQEFKTLLARAAREPDPDSVFANDLIQALREEYRRASASRQPPVVSGSPRSLRDILNRTIDDHNRFGEGKSSSPATPKRKDEPKQILN